jgi:glycosyl transferase family 25
MPFWQINEIPAMCISLKRREDRWLKFSGQPVIRELPNLQRHEATDGKTLDIATDKRILLSTKRNILKKQRRSHEELDSPGGVGCALSHIAIWQEMVQRQVPITLVIEDDAALPNDFAAQANTIINKSPTLQDPQSWDLWILAAKTIGPTPVESDPLVQEITSFTGTIAYVITLRGATKLLEHALPVHCHIDKYMCILKELQPMRYLITPSFSFYQLGVDASDIIQQGGCRICDIPTDFDKTQTLVNKTTLNNLESIRTVFVLSVAFGAGYLLYRRFGGKAD